MQLLSDEYRSSAHSCPFGEAFLGPADNPGSVGGERDPAGGPPWGIDLGNQGEEQVSHRTSHAAPRWLSEHRAGPATDGPAPLDKCVVSLCR